MGKWIESIWTHVQETSGVPIGVRRWCAEHRNALRCRLEHPTPGIDELAVVRWDRLAHWSALEWPRHAQGHLAGWKYLPGYGYSGCTVQCQPLCSLGEESAVDVTLDIGAIDGLSASKSDLRAYESMEAFARARCGDFLQDGSQHGLYANLAHNEIRILRAGSADSLTLYAWDGRVFLSNHGGSHHFAAAQYLASELAVAVPIEATMNVHRLSSAAVEALADRFTVFALPGEPSHFNGFHDAMASFEATYYWKSLPRPLDDRRAVFLPKTERRSSRVSEVLASAGAVDLVAHLRGLALRQGASLARVQKLNRRGEPGFDRASLQELVGAAASVMRDRKLAQLAFAGR